MLHIFFLIFQNFSSVRPLDSPVLEFKIFQFQITPMSRIRLHFIVLRFVCGRTLTVAIRIRYYLRLYVEVQRGKDNGRRNYL